MRAEEIVQEQNFCGRVRLMVRDMAKFEVDKLGAEYCDEDRQSVMITAACFKYLEKLTDIRLETLGNAGKSSEPCVGIIDFVNDFMNSNLGRDTP